MRILFSVTHTSSPGDDLHSTLADGLQRRGHDVSCVQFSHHSRSERLEVEERFTFRSFDKLISTRTSDFQLTTNGRWMFNWLLYHRWKRVLRGILSENDYDVVVSANICVTPTTLAALENNIPCVILTTGPAAVRYDPSSSRLDKSPVFFDLPIGSKLQYPFINRVHHMNRSAFRGADEVVAINEFDASITRETFGRAPSITYIPVALDDYRTPDWSPERITLVNPRTKNKGLDIFLDIAHRLPEQEFQVAGNLYDESKEREIDKLNNVSHLGYVKNMGKIYKTTELLLIPSTYQEGGPRVIPEAAINGIPTIGSDLGGIPEYIGDGGDVVSDYTNTAAWVNAVNRYLNDAEYYRDKSKKAKEAAKRFNKSTVIDEHEKRLKKLCM